MNRFDTLSKQLKVMQQAGLEDTPTYERLLSLALAAAPDSLKSHIMDLAVKEGRLPPPVGFDQNGEKLWRLEDVAAHLGMDAEEAKLYLAEFQEEHGMAGTVDPTSIRRIH